MLAANPATVTNATLAAPLSGAFAIKNRAPSNGEAVGGPPPAGPAAPLQTRAEVRFGPGSRGGRPRLLRSGLGMAASARPWSAERSSAVHWLLRYGPPPGDACEPPSQ